MDDNPPHSGPPHPGPPRRGRPCPICGKPAEPRFRPFCSTRCRMVDLGRWLGGRYAIPTEEPPDEDAPPEER